MYKLVDGRHDRGLLMDLRFLGVQIFEPLLMVNTDLTRYIGWAGWVVILLVFICRHAYLYIRIRH